MKTQSFILAATVAILALASSCLARAEKQPIYVQCYAPENTDLVGNRLCTAVKNKFAKNPRYELVASDATRRWTLHIISMSIDLPSIGSIGASTQSVTLTAYNQAHEDLEVYIDSYVYLIGQDKVSTMADQIVADTDATISRIID